MDIKVFVFADNTSFTRYTFSFVNNKCDILTVYENEGNKRLNIIQSKCNYIVEIRETKLYETRTIRRLYKEYEIDLLNSIINMYTDYNHGAIASQ